jgi:hypothetical protein
MRIGDIPPTPPIPPLRSGDYIFDKLREKLNALQDALTKMRRDIENGESGSVINQDLAAVNQAGQSVKDYLDYCNDPTVTDHPIDDFKGPGATEAAKEFVKAILDHAKEAAHFMTDPFHDKYNALFALDMADRDRSQLTDFIFG